MMFGLLLAATLCLVAPPSETTGHAAAAKEKKKAGKVTFYVRYEDDGDVSYGILEGKKIRTKLRKLKGELSEFKKAESEKQKQRAAMRGKVE